MSTTECAAPPPVPALPTWPLRVLLALIGLALLTLAAWAGAREPAPWTVTAGKVAGLMAAMLLMLQFALSARFKLLDQAFGIDRLLRVHRLLGPLAAVLASLHPMFLFAEDHHLGKLRWAIWPELLGVAALAVLGLIVCTAIWRVFLGMSYEAWRKVHWLTFAAVAIAGVHALERGSDLAGGWPRGLWLGVLGAYALTFLWVKLVRPLARLGRRYTVTAVTQVNHNTHTVELAPPDGPLFGYLPGQFVFLRLRRKGRRTETHPFTLSSSPTRQDAVTVTVKSSGDFTRTIGDTQPGDAAVLDGPYGRFSYVLHSDQDLVMIAGGVGITPMLSMLRCIADTGGEQSVLVLWANRTKDDTFCRDELAAMAAELPSLRVHHVLSRQPGWDGETGHIDAAMLDRLLTGRDRRARVFLCGPPPMMRAVRSALRRLGIPAGRIHTEAFSF